jgi:glutamine amidotransferase
MAQTAESVRVCILDYGSGNVQSVFNLVSTLTPYAQVSNDPATIRAATHLILPGVGAFGASMAKIRARIPLDVVEDVVVKQARPMLGICVGFQIMASTGFEFGEHQGLGWLGGTVRRLEAGALPLPHVGWNDIRVVRTSPLLTGIRPAEDFYFVHSFAVTPGRASDVVATTEYGETFVAMASRGNLHGVQFHPEKSQRAGLRLFENFLALA